MAERMLVIDDEEIVLGSCRKIFTDEGFHVVTTTSPQQGLKLVSDSSFDVILVDWKMPGFDGMDVVEELEALLRTGGGYNVKTLIRKYLAA